MSNITSPGFLLLDLNLLNPLTRLSYMQIPKVNINVPLKNSNQIAAIGTGFLTDLLSNGIMSKFGDSEFGRGFGTLFSSGLNSAGNTITDNLLKGLLLTEGLGKNTVTSLAGTGAGLAANYLGLGINALGGDSMLSRGIGQGVATGLGTIGGRVASNLLSNGSVGQIFGKGAGMINPVGFGMTVAGSALGAAFGPSKEYSGKYGNITRTMDTAYDVAMTGANFIPGGGQIISGAMALNKGLSNIFGSTDGMTKTDAILGSAFMPAPVKWLNMAGAKKTGSFNNQSWLNTEKTNSFMGNAFGNLGDKFAKAREEAGKTYGTFSRGAYKRARNNLNFANNAWDTILAMADQNELQNIRSLYMTSINNLRYAQMIQGGWNPIYRGKQGMKILNNATNHNIGMRLLSAAALIDNKAMILSAQGGTKVIRPKVKSHGRTNLTKPSYMTEEEWNEYLKNRKQFEEYKKSIGVETNNENPYTEEELKQQAEWNAHLLEVRKLQAEEQTRKLKLREEAAAKFNLQANLVLTTMNQQANETPFTGQEYQQAAKNLRLEKIEKFHKKSEELGKGFEAALMADLAVSAAPLLLRSFKWAFNKAGLLVKVPLEKTNLFLTSPYTGKWTQFGNREYRFKPGYVGMNGVPVESRTLKITPENAASITPEQWTIAQDAAIARGDMAEAQRLSDLHAATRGKYYLGYHGNMSSVEKTMKKGLNPYSTVRDLNKRGGSPGYFNSSSENVANTYNVFEGAPTFKTYTFMDNPYVIDANGRTWRSAEIVKNPISGEKQGVAAHKVVERVRKEGKHDGVIIKNIMDVGPARVNLGDASDIADDIVGFPGKVKLADAVTYDNNGVRIPLGDRHNFNINDTRYSWLPWFLGGSTAATLYNTNK